MAKISAMPAQGIVDSLRGTLDFSVWCGTVIVRSWPRCPRGPRSVPSQRTSNQLSAFNSELRNFDVSTVEAFQALASDTSFSWKDMATRNYFDGTKDLYEYQE